MREIFTDGDVISRNRIDICKVGRSKILFFFFLKNKIQQREREREKISRGTIFLFTKLRHRERAIRHSDIDLAPSAVGLLL